MGNGSGKMGAFLTEMIELSANLLDKPALSKDVPAERLYIIRYIR